LLNNDHGDALQSRKLRYDFAPSVLLSHSRSFLKTPTGAVDPTSLIAPQIPFVTLQAPIITPRDSSYVRMRKAPILAAFPNTLRLPSLSIAFTLLSNSPPNAPKTSLSQFNH